MKQNPPKTASVVLSRSSGSNTEGVAFIKRGKKGKALLQGEAKSIGVYKQLKALQPLSLDFYLCYVSVRRLKMGKTV